MSWNDPVGCCEPDCVVATEWFVKMDTTHNPSYYLVNRCEQKHPRVALQKDLIDTTASIYFDNEHQAQVAINSYIHFHSQRGTTVEGTNTVSVGMVESQIMRFK